MYRTGDYGVLKREGYIEFLGRKDNQVKIRGHRIELGEIELALRKQGNITDAAVLVKKRDGEHVPAIYAYAVTNDDFIEENAKRDLERYLPRYMIPISVVRVPQIPLTRNGKVDKGRLLSVETVVVSDVRRHPETKTEKVLAGIWQNVLNVEPIWKDSNYYDLGGDSLKLFKLISSVEDHYNLKITYQSLAAAESLSEMAEVIESLMIN